MMFNINRWKNLRDGIYRKRLHQSGLIYEVKKMSRKFEAKICWLSETQGGRKDIPLGDKYAPIIKLTKTQHKSNDFWSVFVFNKKKISRNETLSNIEYLSDNAPDNLSVGVEFVLYEGSKMVANGIVLREIMC